MKRYRGNRIARTLLAASLLGAALLAGCGNTGIESDEDHLNVVFRALPQGVGPAAGALRTHLLRPGFRRVRALIPSFL